MAAPRPALDLTLAQQGLPALRRQFPHVEADALSLFLGAGLTDESLAALVEMEKEAAAGKADQFGHLPTRGCHLTRGNSLEVKFEGGDSPPHVGTVLHITGLPDLGKEAGIVLPTGEVLALQVAEQTSFWLQDFGMHELRVKTGEEVERCWFMVSSPLGEYGEALDLFNDAYDWVWDGTWTPELEESILHLIVGLDDCFASLASKGAFMSEALVSTLAAPRKRMEKYLSRALESQDPLALGRAVSSIRAFTLAQSLFDMFGPLMGAGQGLQGSSFYSTVVAFEKARLQATSSGKQQDLKRQLRRLVLAADAHVADLYNSGKGQDFIRRWSGGLRAEIWAMLEDAVIHPLPFQQMRGGGGGYVADMMASMAESYGGAQAPGRAETTEAMTTLQPQASFAVAQSKVTRWLESLVDEQISVGNPMAPFEIHSRDPGVQEVLAAVHSSLSLGLGYVSAQGEISESSKLVVLLDRVRASLPLHAPQDFLRERRRKDRLKDVCRVLRSAKKRGQRLSLSVNTDFAGALKALQEHHEDTWVGPALEAVWEIMRQQKRVFAFELRLHEEGKAPRLIAADFGHAHTFGRAYYVATRFFDRSERTLQPGFVLAYAEAECLRRAGFELWDLGGADHSPMMQYKPQVALEMHRSEYLLRLWEIARAEYANTEDPSASLAASQKPLTDLLAAPPVMGERVPQGVVFEDITEQELWGANALQQQEQRKAAQEEEVKAMKLEQAKARVEKAKAKKKAENAKKVKPEASEKKAVKKPEVNGNAAKNGKTPEKVPEPPQEAKDAFTPPSREAPAQPKDDAKLQFLAAVQKLVDEGLSQTEAVAKALRNLRS